MNDHWKSDRQDAARYVKSTDGGATWSKIRTAAVFEAYDASDQGVAGAAEARELADQPDAVDEEEAAGTARDCGDDFDACETDSRLPARLVAAHRGRPVGAGSCRHGLDRVPGHQTGIAVATGNTSA